MALGGGTFLTHNKKLPGTYINFVSVARPYSNIGDRGYATMPLELDWGVDGEVFTVEREEFLKDSVKIFGYDYTHDKLKGLRDLFKGAKTLYAYKLNKGEKAQNKWAIAKYAGIRGNDIKISIAKNIDVLTNFDVTTLVDNRPADVQTVADIGDLKPNDWVTFKNTETLAPTVAEALTGGTNGTGVTGADYQSYLDKIEAYEFNTLGCLSTESTIKDLFIQFTKRMRDEVGAKFQTVLYRKHDADYEGVISVENKAMGAGVPESSLIYWVIGAEAGCEINKSLTNKTYDGDYIIQTTETQTQLGKGLDAGKFLFHKVGDKVNVLRDINTFTSFYKYKNEDFSSNQTIRVLDQIAMDIAKLFNTRYLGKVQNVKVDREELWKDIVKHHEELQRLKAIEDFTEDNVKVSKGDKKTSVVVEDYVTPVNCMEQLYMTVHVS
ncbi:MAG: phage tail sheath family protein [Bacteroidota bacterium]|nr:phage tail sheath family protein [Bacteroidota bacterium]